MSSPIAGVLLAAGAGRRFGRDKRLEVPVDGVPLAVAAAGNLRRAVPWSMAVVRPGDGALAEALAAEGLEITVNPRPERGLGASLAAGVAAAPEAAGWVIALADMPWIRPATLRVVHNALRDGAPLCAPVYRGRRGHPVGFSRSFGPALCALDGDEGARALLQTYAERMLPIPVADPGVLADVDTPADVARGQGVGGSH